MKSFRGNKLEHQEQCRQARVASEASGRNEVVTEDCLCSVLERGCSTYFNALILRKGELK